ncbi:unnamed protein product [Chrysoparadoxa australica]
MVPSPKLSCLRVSPLVDSLPPGQSLRLEVEFNPKENLSSEDIELGTHEGSVEVSGQDEASSQHGHWRIPCYLKSMKGEEHGPLLMLEVNTVVVQRVLSVETTKVNFGQLAVGESKEFILKIMNLGDVTAPLVADGLNSTGPYSLLNALRPISAHGAHKAVLQFHPQHQGIVTETLFIRSPALGKALKIGLRGEGVSPGLRIEPSDGLVNLGAVLEGDRAAREVTLHNESLFPLYYAMKPISQAPQNYSGLAPFALLPPEGEVKPNEAVTVKVVFSPDHERIWPYRQSFAVEVPNQKEQHCLNLVGRCWSRQLYVESIDPNKGKSDPCELVPEAMEDAFALPRNMQQVTDQVQSSLGLAITTTHLHLRFPQHLTSEEERNRTIVIGSTPSEGGGKGGAGTFEVEITQPQPYFKAVPDKGSVNAGSTSEVVFSFTPPEAEHKNGLEVGQWMTCPAFVHLKGGSKPEGDPDTKSVKVELCAYINLAS